MMPALFPEMAQGTFQPLLGRLRNGARTHDYSVAEIRDLLMASGVGAAVLDKIWESLQGVLYHGIEASRLAALVGDLDQTLQIALNEVYVQVRAIAEGETLPKEEQQAGMRALDEYQSRAMTIQRELAKLQRLLDAPEPPIDVEKIIAEADATPGDQYESIDDILERLKAGDDV